MKKIIFILFVFFAAHTASAQVVIKWPVTYALPGACDSTEVYVLLPIKGQTEAVPPITKEAILIKLNNDVSFLNANPKFKGKVMLYCIVNCEGALILTKIDTKSGNDELDQQIRTVFNSLTAWKPGILDGILVDSLQLFSLEIKKGVIVYPN